MDISGNGSADLNIAATQDNTQAWIQPFFFGVEKGSNITKLHLPKFVRQKVAGAEQNTKDLKKALWGTNVANKFVNSKGLTGKGLHTWHGLLGYCQQDMHEEDYRVFIVEDLAQGCDLYCQFGDGNLNNKSVINVHTIASYERLSIILQNAGWLMAVSTVFIVTYESRGFAVKQFFLSI